MATMQESALTDIVQALRDQRLQATMVIGSGVSVSAGIPLAAGVVEAARKLHPDVVGEEFDYVRVMSRIPEESRFRIIGEFVERARFNWAHLLLGWMMSRGLIGRVLSVNFDNLTQRALPYYNCFPAIHDLAASPIYRPDLVRDPAIIQLHGRADGFVQTHTTDVTVEHRAAIDAAVRDCLRDRVVVVVGYSGISDVAVLDRIAAYAETAEQVFWVTHLDEEPSKAVAEKVLTQSDRVFLVRGLDADMLFRRLTVPFLENEDDVPWFLGNPIAPMTHFFKRFHQAAVGDPPPQPGPPPDLPTIGAVMSEHVARAQMSMRDARAGVGAIPFARYLLFGDFDTPPRVGDFSGDSVLNAGNVFTFTLAAVLHALHKAPRDTSVEFVPGFFEALTAATAQIGGGAKGRLYFAAQYSEVLRMVTDGWIAMGAAFPRGSGLVDVDFLRILSTPITACRDEDETGGIRRSWVRVLRNLIALDWFADCAAVEKIAADLEESALKAKDLFDEKLKEEGRAIVLL